MYSSHPAARMRSSSPFIARAVRAITGIARVASSRLSSPMASRPSIPGSWISIKIRFGRSSRANVIPASASVALSTVWPADCNRNTANVMLAGLSSTTRIVAMLGDQLAARHGPPNFGHNAVTVEHDLFYDRRHMASEPGAVLGGDLLGGDHEDRNAGRVRMPVERLHHVEAVYLRHHQIEHDQVRELLPRRIDRLTAAVRAMDGASQAQDADGHQLHRLGIVVNHEDCELLALRERKQTKLDERPIQLVPG